MSMVDQISEQIAQHMPAAAKNVGAEFDRHLKEAVEKTLQRLNLVSREEFDTQQAILLKTRQKLEQLELQFEQWQKDPSDIKQESQAQ